MAIYFTSDLHFGHDNVIRLAERPFSDLDYMHEAIISNINETVGERDHLYVLGDFSFKIKQAEARELRNRIACRNVHLVRGNHDCGWGGTNAFRSVSDYLELKEQGRKLVLFHYPIASWNGMHRKWSVHLHGHIHSRGDYNSANVAARRRAYDVGVDANGFKPVSLEHILSLFPIAVEVGE